MEEITLKIRDIAKEHLLSGKVDKILGFSKGDFPYESCPVFISDIDEIETLIWDSFCVNNLSKYLIEELKTTEKIGVFIKGCDSLSFNQIVQDNRINPDNVVIFGVPCNGMLDPKKIKKIGLLKGIIDIQRDEENVIFVIKNGENNILAKEVKYDKCILCENPNPVVFDEIIGNKITKKVDQEDKFQDVEEIEAMSADEKFDYWSNQFSKCVRCYACRNICPACNCQKCIFENVESGVSSKAKVDSEDQFFHIIRAYHVAGRCVDCGECSRVCPEGIPLEKLNKKIIKDITQLYGEYDAGLSSKGKSTLTKYDLEDIDPFEIPKGRK